jgi:hypothetical protein
MSINIDFWLRWKFKDDRIEIDPQEDSVMRDDCNACKDNSMMNMVDNLFADSVALAVQLDSSDWLLPK